MQFVIPDSLGLREVNACHNPAGPGGGQFCSTTGGAPAISIQKRKAGDGIAYVLLRDKKDVGRISGFEKGSQFHMYLTGLRGERTDPGAIHGSGAYQRAVQDVANRYSAGLYVYEWEASRALKKALAKMPTFERVDDRLVIRPQKDAA